tara:strand:+ start:271 stop:465 length:195 start_codon:yes stop_codon:yes gene_type:complete
MIESPNSKGIRSESELKHGESRIFTKQNVWYYTDANGDNVGPFRYKSEAKSSLEKFIGQLKDRL